MEPTDTALLRAAASRAGRRPGFLAHDLTLFREVMGEDPTRWLSLSPEQLDRLALCRTPRRGGHLGHDVLAIAAHIGVDPVALVCLIRLSEGLVELQESIQRLRHDDQHVEAPIVLAAARDEADEHTVLTETPSAGPGLPGWLHDAVDRFWADVPAGPLFPRDLDFAVLVGLPVAVIEVPELTVKAIETWLTRHKLDLKLSNGRDRRLRACLVALGGVGLIFVDADDDPTQRRVSLAHEAGHFLVEYLLPRKEVSRRRPDLLDVVDGQRPPTARERLSAVLGDVPIGVHAHLLDRGADGSEGSRIDTAEWRARRVALQLLAPQEVVLERMSAAGASDVATVRELLIEHFGLPVSLASDYADQLITDAQPPRLGLLDLLRRQPVGDEDQRNDEQDRGRSSGSTPDEGS